MKKARMRRSLALLLAIVMCIGLLPMGALAAQDGQDGIAVDATEDAGLAVQPDGSSEDSEEPNNPSENLDESNSISSEDSEESNDISSEEAEESNSPSEDSEEPNSDSLNEETGEVTPVHYYTFDEAADAAAVDSGTGKKDGTKTSGIGSADGKAGKAAQFDGSSYIDVDDKTILNGENFTVTAWINWEGGRINTILATSVSGIVEGTGLLFYVHGDGDGVIKAGDGVGGEFNSTGKITPNEWTHVAFVKSGNTAKLYINGQADGEADNSQTGTSQRVIRIGANHNTDAHNFHGAIDELKIFDQALTAEQITAAMEVPPENSSLKTRETTIADADWGKHELTIEANLVKGDSISEVTNVGSDKLTGENGMSISGNIITLNSDFFKAYSEDIRTVGLEVTFAKGGTDTFTIKRGDPTKRFGWSLQKQAEDVYAAIPEGWITQTDNGIVVDHSKMIVDSGHQGWVLYYADGDQLTDSVWEFDMTLTNPDSNQVGFINIAPSPRTIDGKNYEGFAIDTPAVLQRTGRKDGGEQYAGVSNDANLTFEYGKTYHLRLVTEGSHMTVYVTVQDGEEQKLTEFDSPIGLGASTCGFRIWRGGKTITIENMQRKKLVKTGFEDTMVQIEKEQWGQADAVLPYNCEEGDSIQSVANGDTQLTADTEYTAADGKLTVKADYIKAQTGTFSLKVTFTNGHEATLWIKCHEAGVLQEYIWTPDQGSDSWVQLSGDGTIEMGEDKAGEAGLHVKGRNLLVNTLSPMTANGEVELTLQLLSDALPWAGAGAEASGFGVMFREENASSYQSVATNSDINAEPCWDFGKNGSYSRIIWDGHHWESMESVKVYDELQQKDVVKDIKFKVRYYKDSITIWIDDEFCHTQNVANATEAMGQMGLVLGRLGDILVKKAVFREVTAFEETQSTEPDITIEADGLTVRLDGEFPRVIDYTLNDKTMNGAELSYHYATVNNTDYPATATTKDQTADSVTYHVVPDPNRTGVTFDVKFTVKPDHILEMLILNIHEPVDEMVFGIGLPQLPMISANSGQTGAALNASWINKNSRCYQDRNIDITKKDVSTTAAMGVTLPIVSADGLSASMFNNVLIGGDEYNYKGFELADGKVSVGVWNTEWVYRGMDNKKMLPFPSEPNENELYCRVVITEDTNDDGIVNWQDGGNALKKLVNGITPGADQAARSFFHVGYNFSSGAQQPFLQVADNMKRLSNLIDGFSQQLIFKGYANEGHDSGHSDFQDINLRAGGAEDMNVAIAEADKIHSNLGIHINEHEIYPEAKMFDDHTAAGQDAWYWMDHSKILRRYVDMLDTTMENHFTSRMEHLFEKTPDLDFVYVDCWGEDRWGEKKLIGTMLDNGAELFGNENAADFTRFGVWTHSTAGNNSPIHQFVYNSQKDIYGGSGIYWGGYNRAASMMSWQHNKNINTMVEQFFTNQLPQKYLMCHDVRRIDGSTGYFTGNITSSNYVITKDGNKITDGAGKIFIPWYAEDSTTKDPDGAAKIYHWNSDGGPTTWTLPNSWNDVTTVYLYKTTQTGKVLVDTLTVDNHQVTINADAKTGYVLYPAEAEADVTEWSTGSPLKDTMFNSRDDSIWKQSGEAAIAYNDDGNGVSILTIKGTEAGQVSQVMTGLTVGQKYRVAVWAGAANGKTARITVKQDGKTYENYVDQVTMNCQYFDDYALGKPVQRMWVDFTATSETAEVILSGDACESASGTATFMQARMVKTAEPDLPKGCVANETFEYVEQGAYGIFSPEGAADGGPHLSETHLPYTTDTITGDWSLKLYGARGQGASVRTNPSTMRLKPNASYLMEFNTQGNGWVKVQSESDGNDVVLNENTQAGAQSFTFTTGSKTDYIVRINCSVLDDFVVYEAEDNTPPTAPGNLTAQAVENDNAVILTWGAATDDDGQIGSYKIYRNGSDEPIAVVGKDTLTYTDRDTLDETAYTYQVSAVNLGQTEGPKSNVAAVTTKVLPPEPVEARMIDGVTITVTFNKAMEKASAETAANYTLTGMSGITVAKAALSADGRTVTLTIDGLDMTKSVTVTVANVKDATGKGTIEEKSFTCSLIEHYFKLDEAADAAAVDETGHKNGTKLSGVGTAEGKYGQAATFNGKSYIQVESDALYRPDAFTVSAWINWDGSSGVNAIVGNDVAGNASSVGIIFFVDGGSGVLRTNSNLCAVVGSSDKKVTANEWHHVAFVKNVGSAQVYLDGEMIGSANVQFGKEANTPIRIGGSSGNNPSYPFHGAIDEVKIFSTGLSEADIALLAGQQLAPTPNAKFNAMTMTLSDVAAGMKYSVDEGQTWVDITGSTADLSNAKVTAANGIWVKQPGDGETTADSRIQVITLTQAAKPENITKTDETAPDAKDGTITGVTAAMEYSADGGATWISGTGAVITGLAPQEYLVRVKATVDMLASEPLTVTIERGASASVTGVKVYKDGKLVDENTVLKVYTNNDHEGHAHNHSLTLTAEVEPETAANKNVNWRRTEVTGKVTLTRAENNVLTVTAVHDEAETNVGVVELKVYAEADTSWNTYQTINVQVIRMLENPVSISIHGVNDPNAAPKFGQTLEADINQLKMTDAGKAALSYQWKRNGSAISGATAKTYTLTAADIGATISVDVTADPATYYEGTRSATRSQPVEKADGPNIPGSTIHGVQPTTEANNDGRIVGFGADFAKYEYKARDAAAWTAVKAEEVTGLQSGEYQVRIKETATHKAGAAINVTVPPYNSNYKMINIAADMVNGTVTRSVGQAAPGTTITLTVKPDTGYKLVNLAVTTASGTVTCNKGSDVTEDGKTYETYTFTMPGEDVTVSATFGKLRLTITHELTHLTCSRGAGSDSHEVDYGETAAITLVPDAGYGLPAGEAIEITNAKGDKITGWTISRDGTITITGGVTSNLTIKASGVVKTYVVNYTLTNGLSAPETGAPRQVAYKAAYTGKLVAASGYTLPERITVTMGGEEFTDFTYENGTLTIAEGKITGNLVVTASGVTKTYEVNYTLTNGLSAPETGAPRQVAHKAAYTGTLVAASGYLLPESITVTMGGEEFTDFTYENGTLTIAEGKITGNLVVTASGTADGGSGDSGSSSGGGGTTTPPASTEVKENPDGSTTTTVTDRKTGTVTETTEWPDGTKEIVETKKDGTVTETTEKPDGSKEVVETKPDGTLTETKTDTEGGEVAKVTDPDKNVEIKVTDPSGEVLAEVKLPAEIPVPENRFVDVPENHWADEAVHEMAGLGLVNGVGNGKFDMSSNMKRGDLALILSRLSNAKTDYELTFTDVPAGKYYANGVAWAAKSGVVTGRSAEKFDPEATITRGELAVMLYRYAMLLKLDTTASAGALEDFKDGSATPDWAMDGLAWCVENGILKGKGGGILDSTAATTRAEVAVMLQRFVNLMK